MLFPQMIQAPDNRPEKLGADRPKNALPPDRLLGRALFVLGNLLIQAGQAIQRVTSRVPDHASPSSFTMAI